MIKTLHGNWKCNVEKTVELMKDMGAPDDQIEMVSERLSEMEMVISEESIVLSGDGEDKKATYTVEKSDEEKNMIMLKLDPEDRDEPVMVEFTLDGKDAYQMSVNGMTVAFDRKKEEEKSDG